MADTRFFLGNLRKKPTVQPPLGYAEVAPNTGCSLLPLGKKNSDDAKIVIFPSQGDMREGSMVIQKYYQVSTDTKLNANR